MLWRVVGHHRRGWVGWGGCTYVNDSFRFAILRHDSDVSFPQQEQRMINDLLMDLESDVEMIGKRCF